MKRTEEEALVRDSAARLYGDGQEIWNPTDRWNARKRAAIDHFATRFAAPLLAQAGTVLDAGCGCEPYAWLPSQTISFDRFWRQTVGRGSPVAGDLCQLPFADQSIDFTVCVASVLNYVSALEAISELGRCLRKGGHLLLHFETSTSFEHLGSSEWGSSVARLVTINSGRTDTIWIYRPSFILAALVAAGFVIRRREDFHVLSALGLRLGLSQHHASPLSALDRFIPFLGEFSDDVILLAEKLV